MQDKELENDPEFTRLKSSLQATLNKCDSHKKDCEDALNKIDLLENKIKKQQDDVENDEQIEKDMTNPITAPDVKLPTIDEIDQEIQAKIEDNQQLEPSTFPDMNEITPENYPTLYYMYERVLQSEYPENNPIIE